MGKRTNKFNSDLLRARVRQMLAAGFSEARMVKETGRSARHIALIAGQEREDMRAAASFPEEIEVLASALPDQGGAA